MGKALVAILVLLFSQAVIGQSSHFFKASIPVVSQSQSERAKAASLALQEVLVRVSGSKFVLENEALFSQIDNAIKVVDSFKYAPITRPQALPVDGLVIDQLGLDADELTHFSQVLEISFNANTIERILRNANVRYWPVNRPNTLVWLVKDDVFTGRELVNRDFEPKVTQILNWASKTYGVALSYPLLDLDDNIALSLDRAWAFDEQAILSASSRYNADSVLVGRLIYTSQGELRSSWQYFHRGETTFFDSSNLLNNGAEQRQFSEAVIAPIANFLANKYAIIPVETNETGLILEVAQISSYQGYRELLTYVDSLAAVEAVKVKRVAGDVIQLIVETDVSQERLNNAFALDKRLNPVVSDVQSELPVWQRAPQGSETNPLTFSWNG